MTAGVLGLGKVVPRRWRRSAELGRRRCSSTKTLALALDSPQPNTAAYRDFPPKAIEHAKMILASTFASAAAGSVIDSARIVRQLAKEQGGKPEATIWFDGTKVPASEAARVNAILSDAAASTTATSATPPMKERHSPRWASPSPSAPARRVRTCSAR